MWRSSILGLALVCVVIFSGKSQTVVSPYSNNGLGELVFQGMPNHIGMGEIGIGTPSYWQINSVNPAFLVNNTLTTFEVGFQADIRSFNGSNTSGSDATGGLRFLNISFPIMPAKWTSNVALLPYSTVNYDFFNNQEIVGAGVNAQNNFSGEGGITRLDWANGIRLRNNLAVGVKTSYLFGSIRNSTETFVEGDETPFSIVYSDEVSYQDFTFLFGAYYRHNLAEDKAINLGVIYGPSTTLSGTRDEIFTRRANAQLIQSQDIDVDQVADFELPETLGFGISYQHLNKLLVGADLEINSGGEFSTNTTVFRQRLKLGLGTEFTPDFRNVRSYWRRINYRAGITYQQSPYIVNGSEINDFAISVGGSLPISGVSTFDSAFKLGWRGTNENNLIRESYFQIVIGATINERWFIKRRYD